MSRFPELDGEVLCSFGEKMGGWETRKIDLFLDQSVELSDDDCFGFVSLALHFKQYKY